MSETKPITAESLEAEYMIWFAKLEAVAGKKLDPDQWVGRWYDYFAPEEAWEAGPERETW
jgi:hypothetical protein